MIPALLAAAVFTTASAAQEVIDVHASAGVLVPVDGSGTLPIGGLGIGAAVSDQDLLRLRVLGAPLDRVTVRPPREGFGWGTLLELEHRFGSPARIVPVWTGSVGFVAAESPGPSAGNLTQLALHTSAGFSIACTPPGPTGALRLTPVMGVAPRLFADDRLLSAVGPTFEVRVGWGP